MALDDALPQVPRLTATSRLARWLSVSEPDWDAVYAAELPRVYNFLRYRVGHDADAQDLTGRTFEKAWTARHRYRRDLAGFSTWLLAIARNVANDHQRARRPHVAIDEAGDTASGVTPEEEAVRRSDAARLSSLLVTLPDRERELLAMKYGAELTNREIARATGLTESNVGTILHRTILALRSQWTPEQHEGSSHER
jgi:RNA polymerase sigma-70 factor, ECF subfamily